MIYEKARAFTYLKDLFAEKDARFKIVKLSCKEDRPVSVYVGEDARGHAEVQPVHERYPEAVKSGEFTIEDFYIKVNGPGPWQYIRTSPIQRVGVTPEGVILAETLNSIYRLERVTEEA